MAQPNIFISLLERGIKEGAFSQKVTDAREWFRNQAQNTKVGSVGNVIANAQDQYGSKTILGKHGKMVLFSYDPKTKISLPYYDRYPLIFPFRIVPGGFYGINLHYLPHRFRAMLMDGLYDLTNNKKYDETTKVRINYALLSSYSKLKYFRPCVKFYLNNQIRSSIITIPSSQWDIALFLPLERFVGAPKAVVHTESIKIARGIK